MERTNFHLLAVLASVIGLCLSLVGCGEGDTSATKAGAGGAGGGRVVVYTSVDRIFAEPVLAAAGKSLGLEVVGVYDTEETKSTGLVNRLIAKRDAPDGDIFWSGDPARAALLSSKGITAPYTGPLAAAFDARFRDASGHWIGFSARTRVLLVNTRMVDPGDEPTSLFELTQPKWRDKVAMANPLFGTTSFHVAALFERLGDEAGWNWLDGLRGNGVRLVSSNGEVKRQVASGAVAVGLTDSDDAAEAIADGQPVRAVLLDQIATPEPPSPALGTLLVPNTVSLIRGGPNQTDAQRVLEYLLSEEAALMLAASCAQTPLRPDIEPPAGARPLTAIASMDVDYAKCAERLERLLPDLKTWVDRR